jgi:hypothetical protein
MTMETSRMKTHIELLGWINIVAGALFIPITLFIFVILAGRAPLAGDPSAPTFLLLVAIAVPALLIVLALPDILAGIGLLKRKAWARPLALVLGVLGLKSR